jgi:hypothetical protein
MFWTIKEDSEIALSSITLPYSWFNITSAYNNKNFKFFGMVQQL